MISRAVIVQISLIGSDTNLIQKNLENVDDFVDLRHVHEQHHISEI